MILRGSFFKLSTPVRCHLSWVNAFRASFLLST